MATRGGRPDFPRALRLLLPFLTRYRLQVAGATVALLSSAALVLVLGQGLRRLIDGGFASGSPAQLNATALAVAGVIALLAIATTARFTLVTWLGERIGADIRQAVFDHVIALSPAWFETARTGDVLSRLQADTAVLQALTGSALSQWLRASLLLVGAFAMLVITSPLLSALVAAVVPLVVVPLVVFSRRERRLSRVAQERVADLGALAEETLNALRTVQAFTQEPFARARFAAGTEQSVAAALARIRSRAGVIFVVILLGCGAITLALWVGGQQVLAGRLSGGALSAFVFYAVIVATSGAGLSELWGEMQRAAGAADRIAELLAETPGIAAPAHPRPLPVPPQGRVAFDGVVFHYPARPNQAALDGFTLDVEPGETVALVGPSGAGKTTVLQLLLRFYDPQSGAVRLDGVDVRDADPAGFRARLGLVPQDPVVFGADAWTNVRFGRPHATDAQVRAAARAAQCDFIEALPQGWDTFLGEKGVRLSGGQRQRLAIARAILRDPAVELMPIKEYPGSYSWGYNPRYFFAIESSYGTTEDLKRFIDECHGRGIRVIMDGIYNHSEASSPLTQIDHDYWYHHSPRDPDNNWGPEFNYEFYDEKLETYPARKCIGDTVRFWIQEYHFVGIRYDAARQIANYDFMHWIVQEAKKTANMKPFYNIAEHIPETTSITNVDGPMDGCWHDSFRHTITVHICGDTFDLEQLKDVIDCKRQGFMGATNVVNYLTNHDHDHIMVELGNRQIFDEEAFRRVRLGVAILMTAVGVPLIWMGEEFGEYKPKTQEAAKIDWKLLGNDLNKGLSEYYKGLINLRKENHALYTENIDFIHENPETKVLAYSRWNDEGSRVVVIANFSENFLAGYTISNFPAAGTWHEWTGNYDVQAGDDSIMTDLGPYEAKVFVWHS